MISDTRVCGMPISLERRYADISSGTRNSYFSTSPGCMFLSFFMLRIIDYFNFSGLAAIQLGIDRPS
jgi:hypothetical protein